jgi:hypothetical protein
MEEKPNTYKEFLIKRFNNFPHRAYNGEVVKSYSGKYRGAVFKNEEEISDFCKKKKVSVKSLCLVFANPIFLKSIEVRDLFGSPWEDLLDFQTKLDDSVKKEIECCLTLLNSYTKKHPPISYEVSSVKVVFGQNSMLCGK